MPAPFCQVCPQPRGEWRRNRAALRVQREMPALLPGRADFAMRDGQADALRDKSPLSIDQCEGDAVEVNGFCFKLRFLGREKG